MVPGNANASPGDIKASVFGAPLPSYATTTTPPVTLYSNDINLQTQEGMYILIPSIQHIQLITHRYCFSPWAIYQNANLLLGQSEGHVERDREKPLVLRFPRNGDQGRIVFNDQLH